MDKLLEPEQINLKAQMIWTNKGVTSKNAQLTNAINDMLTSIKHLTENEQHGQLREQHGQPTKSKEEVPNKLTELSKSCEQTRQPNTTRKRKRDQREINKPPMVPIFHPTHHNNTHQNGPNSGSKGEICPATEHRRSKVGPMPNET
eukprot:13487872-Ditylum_brightwellii.AAC.1